MLGVEDVEVVVVRVGQLAALAQQSAQAGLQGTAAAATVADADAGQGGVRVLAVTAGSLAERSGLAVGDRLLEVAGRPTASAGAVIAGVRAAPPGTWLPLRVKRGEATFEAVIRFPPSP